MTSVVLAVFYLSIAFHMYQDAKRNGQWSWLRFLSILAAMGVFSVAFILPVASWGVGTGRPGLVIAVMLSGIVVFVAGLIIVLRKMPMKATPVDAPPNGLP
jgi:tetrahydromethanopterin S-methyltransferase subunit C